MTANLGGGGGGFEIEMTIVFVCVCGGGGDKNDCKFGWWGEDLFVLRFYGPVNPMGSCRARSVYLTTRLLGRLSPLSS